MEVENLWVYVGNLNWFRPPVELERAIRDLLDAKAIHDIEEIAGSHFGDFVERVQIAEFSESAKLKPRDRSKLHQGFALIKFSDCCVARTAVNFLVGVELPNGAGLGPLRCALSRTKVRFDCGHRTKLSLKSEIIDR